MNGLNDERQNMIERLQWMRVTRLIGVLFILAVYITVNIMKIMSFSMAPFIALCLIEGFINQPYSFMVKRVKDLNRLAYFHLVMDLLLISGVIHFLGGIEFSFFNAFYPLIIIGSAMILNRGFVFKLTTLASIAYALIVGLEHYGIISHTPVFGQAIQGHFQLGLVIANIFFFYLIAFLSTYSSGVLEEKSMEIASQRDYAEGLLSMIMDGLMILDKNGTITKVNDTTIKLLGYGKEQLVGANMIDTLCHEASRPRIKEAIESLHLQKSLNNISLDLLKKDGSKLPIKMNAVDLKCSGKMFSGSFIIIHDKTSEREAEKVQSDFLSNISHELNTPLAVINGFTKTLLEKRDITEPERIEFLKIMDDEAERLKRIIEDLMGLARMEMGWIKINKDKGQIVGIIREVANGFVDLAKKRKLFYHINIPDQILPFYFDQVNIRRVITRLLDNAFKYTDYGEITIEAEDTADKVFVSVSDTGKLIAEKQLMKAFEMFSDDSSKCAGIRKMNINLPVIKHIVEAHGGSIWARSQEGQGTKFTFALPKEI